MIFEMTYSVIAFIRFMMIVNKIQLNSLQNCIDNYRLKKSSRVDESVVDTDLAVLK